MKVILSQNRPLPAEKSEAVVKNLTEFLGLEPEDIFVLHGFSLQLVDVPGAKHKAKDKAEHSAEHQAEHLPEHPPAVPSTSRIHGRKEEPHK